MEIPIRPDETLETTLDGKLRIIQKRRGYRYSIDAILLAHFSRLRKDDHVIDLGTGNAIIPLLLVGRGVGCHFVGVDIQEDLVDMARRNIIINHVDSQIHLLHRDVNDLTDCLRGASFDAAITNPPYRPVRSGRVNPNAEKALARHEIVGSLQDMARAASFLLRSKGRFYAIYPASRTVDMVLTMRESGLEPKRLQTVHSNVRAEAKLVMVEGVKEGREGLKIQRPIFVYDLRGGHTHQIERIYATFRLPVQNTAHRRHDVPIKTWGADDRKYTDGE